MALFGKKKEDVSQGTPPDMGMTDQDYTAQGGYEQYPQEQYPQEGYPEQYAQPTPQPAAPQPGGGLDKERIQEIAEAIVEEKWKEKEAEIIKITDWKEDVTTQLTQLKQQVVDLKSSFDNLHKGMLGKITEYDENLTNVGTEIKAMEKVFSKVLPSLTDSVNKLGRISGMGVRKKE